MKKMTETWMPVSGTFKNYVCDIQISHWEEGTVVWSKGHHPPEVFAAAASAAWLEDEYGPSPPPDMEIPAFLSRKPDYEWWATRMWGGMTGPYADYTYMHDIVDPWANGAYPVTVVRA